MNSYNDKILQRISIEELSFSLEGEDRIAKSLLREAIRNHNKDDCFFIDIGSNHPQKINNTLLFSLMGFKGICVEPITKYNNLYKEIRPKDLIINKGISEHCETKAIRIYEDDAASSIHAETVDRYDKKFRITETKKIECITYDELLKSQKLHGQSIPLIDIDVEGEDLNTLRQIVRSDVKPLLICVENKLANLERPYPSTEIDSLAHENGYALIAKTALNSFYILKGNATFDWIPKEMIGSLN